MRYIVLFWALPLGIFWGWYFLSLNDMNFGFVMLTRDVHDLAFRIYGQLLGIDPDIIPGLVARACVVDTLLIMALFAFRRRSAIMNRFRSLRSRDGTDAATLEVGRAPPAE